MNFGLTYDQLAPVAGTVRGGVVAHDSGNPQHQAILRQAAPVFLGSVASVHGGVFSEQHMRTLEEATRRKEIIARIQLRNA